MEKYDFYVELAVIEEKIQHAVEAAAENDHEQALKWVQEGFVRYDAFLREVHKSGLEATPGYGPGSSVSLSAENIQRYDAVILNLLRRAWGLIRK